MAVIHRSSVGRRRWGLASGVVSLLVLFALCIIETLAAEKPEVPCVFRKKGVTYDLTQLYAPRGSVGFYLFGGKAMSKDQDSYQSMMAHEYPEEYKQHVEDMEKGDKIEKYDYVFNICGDVYNRPRVCLHANQAPAYQVISGNLHDDDFHYQTWHHPKCFALGRLDNMTWDLVDESEPGKGVQIMYEGGDTCTKIDRVVKNGETVEESHPIPRTVTLKMYCDPKLDNSIAAITRMSDRVTVMEPDMCKYVVSWPTALACPLGRRPPTPIFTAGSKGSGGGGFMTSFAFAFIVSVVLLGAATVGGFVLLVYMASRKHKTPAIWYSKMLPMLMQGNAEAWREFKLLLKKLFKRDDFLPFQRGFSFQKRV